MTEPLPQEPPPTILAVDDSPDNLSLLTGILRSRYRVQVANSGERALDLVGAGPTPNLILLDVIMPGMDGLEVCRRLKASAATRDIPVIFLTALSNSSDEARGFELGAVDYITKPISPSILLARVRTHLSVQHMQDQLRDQNHALEAKVQRRTAELAATQDVTIHALASLAETRDLETGNHIRRTQHYVRLLAERLRTHPRFSQELGRPGLIDLLFKCAPLHDIGKVGIPDYILLKPGRFLPSEFEVMKRHPRLGRDAIEKAEKDLPAGLPFLEVAKQIIYGHHERWDGSGYPEGLAGDAIPVAARLMALADVYDALISRRVYKPALPHERAAQVILDGSGSHFDPDVVVAFQELRPEFERIARIYADSERDIQAKIAEIRKLHSDGARVMLLKAEEEHNLFVERILGERAKGADAVQGATLPDHHQCAFGQWYDGEGRWSFGERAAFLAIESVHARAHLVARRLMDAVHEGQEQAVEALSAELQVANSEIVGFIRSLDLPPTDPSTGMTVDAPVAGKAITG